MGVVVCLTEVATSPSSWGIACYWNPGALLNFGEKVVKINLNSEKRLSQNLLETSLTYKVGDKDGKSVKHFFFSDFPDLGVPRSNTELANLVLLVIQELTTLKGNQKVLVHCRSGIGRTGTFLTIVNAVLMIHDQYKSRIKDPLISIFSILRQLRE